MIVHRFRETVPAHLAAALAAFEEGFTYPLGPNRTFRISHGDDYPRFFRAMGEASVFVAERAGRVVGCLAVAVRWLLFPDGGERPVAYFADLKVAPDARAGFALRRLMADATEQLCGVRAAFGVVMEGTRVTPAEYTGRVGVPAFAAVGRVAVLRVPTVRGEDEALAEIDGEAVFRRLSAGRYAPVRGRAEVRSESPPVWLVSPEADACGLLEDTRRAKRLIADDGSEMRSAHLSCFAAATPVAAARLLRRATAAAQRRGFPALFVAVPEADAPAILETWTLPDVVVAPAVVYGAGLPAGEWNINTAEI